MNARPADIAVQYSNLTREECDYLNAVYDMIKRDGVPADDDADAGAPAQFNPITPAGQAIAHQVNQSAAPAAAPAGQTANPDVDAFGVPWNPAIHTSTRNRIQSGAWKLKKGVDKAAAQAWIARHQRQPGAQADAQSQMTAPAGAPTPPAAPMPPLTAAANLPAAPMNMPPLPTAGEVVYPDPGYGAWYEKFMALYQAGRLLAGTMEEMMRQGGVANVGEYENNARARGHSWAFMEQL